jgi:hypothetical protein
MVHVHTGLAAVVSAVGAMAPSLAADIVFVGPLEQSGTGFGSVLTVLALQARPEESGAVVRENGEDVLLGDATNQSQTRSVAEFLTAGLDPANLGVVFNINDPGSSPVVTLNQFEVLFYDANDTLLFTQEYSGPPLELEPVGQGQGGSGYLFDIELDAAQQALFGDPANRIGLRVETPIQSTAAGAESFYLVPAPNGAALLALAGLMASRRPRRSIGTCSQGH